MANVADMACDAKAINAKHLFYQNLHRDNLERQKFSIAVRHKLAAQAACKAIPLF